MTNQWVKMVKQGGPQNWTQYTWYDCGADLGAGKAAMMYDADILGYFNSQGTKEAGNIASTAFTANPNAQTPSSNVWIWSLATIKMLRGTSCSGRPVKSIYSMEQLSKVRLIPSVRLLLTVPISRTRSIPKARLTTCQRSRRLSRMLASTSRHSLCSSRLQPTGPQPYKRCTQARIQWGRRRMFLANLPATLTIRRATRVLDNDVFA